MKQLPIIITLAWPFLAACQPRVSGIVTNEEGLPLPGASVVNKTTRQSTLTDLKGIFVIPVSPYAYRDPRVTDTLFISSPGYRSRQLPVPVSGSLSVRMEKMTVSVGQQIPAYLIQSLAAVSSETSPVFNDGPALLCFITLHCKTSIAFLSVLDSFRQAAGRAIQVLVIASASPQQWRSFFEKHPALASGSLTFINDTLLRHWLPHRLVPHLVWLSAGNRLAAITGHREFTSQAFSRFLAGQPLSLPLKKDMDFDPSQPLLQDDNGGPASAWLYRSSWSARLPGMASASGFTFSTDSLSKRIWIVNHPVKALYRYALPPYLHDRMILDTAYHGWDAEYCYELLVPASLTQEQVKQLMLQDFNRYLGLQGVIMQRQSEAWVLTGSGKAVVNNTSGLSPAKWVKSLGRRLCFQLPLLNETGADSPLRIPLPGVSVCSLEQLNSFLHPYNVKLTPARRELPCFILSPAVPAL